MMFQLASSDGSTGPRAFAISAGSASVPSPNCDRGPPLVVVAPPGVVAPPVVPVVVVFLPPPHAAATNTSRAKTAVILLSRCMFSSSGRWPELLGGIRLVRCLLSQGVVLVFAR